MVLAFQGPVERSVAWAGQFEAHGAHSDHPSTGPHSLPTLVMRAMASGQADEGSWAGPSAHEIAADVVEFFPRRPVDASHPEVLLDLNRCIQCELCVRASRDVDGKSIFALAGRGMASHIIINSPTGKLGDTNFSVTDMAAHVCPVGAILIKRVGYVIPIGERRYDLEPISEQAMGRREAEEAT